MVSFLLQYLLSYRPLRARRRFFFSKFLLLNGDFSRIVCSCNFTKGPFPPPPPAVSTSIWSAKALVLLAVFARLLVNPFFKAPADP